MHIAVSAIGQNEVPARIIILDPSPGEMQPRHREPLSGFQGQEPDYSPDGSGSCSSGMRLTEAGGADSLSALFVVDCPTGAYSAG